MMNLLGLFLVVTSLAAAGVWSPTPEKQGEDVIVKEGHRTVVVEYERGGHPNTKVSIAPAQQHGIEGISSAATGMVEDAKEKIKEASSYLPNIGQGISETSENGWRGSHGTSRELICDAFGKCKHKLASAMGKAKEMVSEPAHEAIEKKKHVAHEIIDETKGKVHEVIDDTKEKVHDVGEAAGHALGKAKETVSKRAHEVEERAKESVKDAMDKVKKAKEVGKTIGEDIAMNVSDKVEMATEKAAEKAKQTQETVEHASDKVKSGVDKLKQESKEELRGIIGRGRQVGHDVVKYVKSPEAMNSFISALSLLGFATAYGMCMWVTFVSSHILAAAMPRQQLGIVQSKIYPVYFRAMAYCIAVSLLGHLLGSRKRLFSSMVVNLQGCNLLASLLMVLVNAFYLEPRATKVMFERLKLEKEEGRGKGESTAEPTPVLEPQPCADPTAATTTSTDPSARSVAPEGTEHVVVKSKFGELNDRLKKLNAYSSLLNILTLMALNCYLVYLSQFLHLPC